MILKKKSRAEGLWSVSLGILLIMATSPMLIDYIQEYFDNLKSKNVAVHVLKVTEASHDYIQNNYQDLLTSTTATTGTTLLVADLINEDFLPKDFAHKNVFLQDYTVHIRQPTTGKLEGIVLTHTDIDYDAKFKNITAPHVANLLKGIGGYIPTGNIPGQNEDMLLGAYGSWAITLSSMGITSPGPGNVGAITSFTAPDHDFLYRIAIPGSPYLNAMQTELDMTDHAITSVKSVQFESHKHTDIICSETDNQGSVFFDEEEGMYICRENEPVVIADTGNSVMIKDTIISSNDDLIDKPICPSGTNTEPQIYVTPQIVSVGEITYPLASIQAWASDENDSQWRVHLRVLVKKDEWIYPDTDYAKALVLTTCNKPIIP